MAQNSNFKIFYALSIAFQLGFLIILPIVGFVWLGLLGDKLFSTKPTLLILSIIVGVSLSFYEMYHLMIPFIKDDPDD